MQQILAQDLKKNVFYSMCLEIIYLMNMYKKDLALKGLQLLLFRKTKPNQTKSVWIVDNHLN